LDYTSFGTGDQKQKTVNKFWWKVDGEVEMANSIQSAVSTIAKADSQRQGQYNTSARLYGNADLMGSGGVSLSRATSTQTTLRDRISYNVVKSSIDTVTAKIAKNRPKPLFLTSGGNWKMQRKAQNLTKFIEGVFYENDMRRMGPMAFRDACVLGDGVTHVFPLHGRVKYERVIPSELYVDRVDGYYGDPRQMHRVKAIDRQILIELFSDKSDVIRNASEARADITGQYQNIADQIGVAESWHLPSGPDATDGMHCISIDGHILFKEEWTHPVFPFAFLPWSKRLDGFWSMGLSEEIQNIQLEINKLLWVIQRSMHLAGSFKIFIENSSKIVKEHLSNDIGSLISYTGQQPTYLTPPIVPPEIYSHLMTLKNAAFEQAGISQLSASAQKPAGLNSGKALREYNDIETERFMTVGHGYEQYHLDLARLSVMTAKDIYKDDKSYSVKVPGKKWIDQIKWKDVDLTEDQYIMKMYPVSSLPNDPEGRLQTVQEYVQAGFYTARTAKKLLDFPDTETVDDLQSAEEDYLHKIMEQIIDDDTYTPPDPFDDLALALELSLEYIAQGKRDNLPEDKMEMLRQFNQQVKDLQLLANPPPPPMAPPGGAMPPNAGAPSANPMAPPQSDLLPNGATQ
jgi:hypothetical protein